MPRSGRRSLLSSSCVPSLSSPAPCSAPGGSSSVNWGGAELHPVGHFIFQTHWPPFIANNPFNGCLRFQPTSVHLEASDHRHRNYRFHSLGIRHRVTLHFAFFSFPDHHTVTSFIHGVQIIIMVWAVVNTDWLLRPGFLLLGG